MNWNLSPTIPGTLLFALLGMLAFSSCKKDHSQTDGLSGVYTETIPYPGKTQLNFIGGNKVIISGDQLSNQSLSSLDTAEVEFPSQTMSPNPGSEKEVFFIYGPPGAKDTARFWLISFNNNNSFGLSFCAPGVPCLENLVFEK
ncbi:MAG: hypothetical protein P4L51_30110 [Puia sp.]|nr:hypothetical protein [Puia sp.]